MRQEKIRRMISLAMLAVLMLIFSLTTKNFFTVNNLLSVLRESSIVGIIAVGVTYAIITAGIDLSTGGIIGLAAMISANLLYYQKLPGSVIIIIAILAGTAAGLLNGILITALRIPDFIATLSTQFIFRGLMLVFAIKENGSIVSKVIEDKTILFFGGDVNGVFYVIIAFVIVAVFGQIFLKKTKWGTYIYATGSNSKSAELSGIDTNKVKLLTFTITGFLCGLASLFQMGRVGSVSTDTGNGLEFDVVSAVVVGGCAFSGGRGDVVGSVIGALFMSVLQNGILKYNVSNAIQLIVKGGVIIVMVVFDAVYNQYMEEKITGKSRMEEIESGGEEA